MKSMRHGMVCEKKKAYPKSCGGRGGSVAELVARPPTDPKVCGSNHRGPKSL
jgi:hypothetical protein